MMNWDTDKTKLLIEEYRKRRILWDLRDPNYINNQNKAKLWKELALKFNCSTKEIKCKVKNLRTTFHRYRKKKIKSDKNYHWIHFVSLSFLLNVNEPKKRISAEDINSNEDINFENDDVENQKENQAAGREFIKPAYQLRKRRKQEIDKNEETRRIDNTCKILKNTSQRDEFATFGEHVANEIRKLNWAAQTIAKHRINNILFDAAIGKFDASSSTHTVSWSSYSNQNSFRPTLPMSPCTSPISISPKPHAAPSNSSSLSPDEMPSSKMIEKTTEQPLGTKSC